jgi:hypothetical protein
LRVKKNVRGKSRGIPHLAKNERDVGHPGVCSGMGLQKEQFRYYEIAE